MLVLDSSAVRRLLVRLAGAVGRQSALHKESSWFAARTPSQHISTFRGYRILFSIRNPYINRFVSPIIFLFIHNHLTLRKWCYIRFSLRRQDPTISPFHFHFRTYKRLSLCKETQTISLAGKKLLFNTGQTRTNHWNFPSIPWWLTSIKTSIYTSRFKYTVYPLFKALYRYTRLK